MNSLLLETQILLNIESNAEALKRNGSLSPANFEVIRAIVSNPMRDLNVAAAITPLPYNAFIKDNSEGNQCAQQQHNSAPPPRPLKKNPFAESANNDNGIAPPVYNYDAQQAPSLPPRLSRVDMNNGKAGAFYNNNSVPPKGPTPPPIAAHKGKCRENTTM